MDSDIKLMFGLCAIFIGLCALFLSIIVLTPPVVPQCKDAVKVSWPPSALPVTRAEEVTALSRPVFHWVVF